MGDCFLFVLFRIVFSLFWFLFLVILNEVLFVFENWNILWKICSLNVLCVFYNKFYLIFIVKIILKSKYGGI